MVVDFTACVVFLAFSGIHWTYVVMCSINVNIMTAIAIIAWRGAAVYGLLITVFSWTSTCQYSAYCVSAMSHPKSGILLHGTTFLPSLTFPICSSSYSWHTFSVMGIFFTSLQ